MKLLNKLFGLGERKSSSRVLLQDLLGRQAAKSGASVTVRTALEITTMLACARVIADGLAQVPWKLYRDLPAGGKEVIKDHPVARLMRNPNDWMTSFELRETIGLHLVVCGEAFLYKVRGLRGEVVELLPFLPQNVTIKRNQWELTYRLSFENGGALDNVPAADVWHVRGPSWDGWNGMNAVKILREALGLALATEEHSGRMFSNGAKPGGVLTTDAPKLDEKQRQELQRSWDERQGGNANAFKTAILWGGLKWQPIGHAADQSQLIEQRRFQVEEICRGVRVLPIMIGHADKTQTFASAEQMFIAHAVHTMGPVYRRIEESADKALLTKAEREAGYYTHFTIQALMRGSHADRSAYFAKALGSGGSPAWMTQDEVRELEELNPLGGAAAKLPVATNVPQGMPNAA